MSFNYFIITNIGVITAFEGEDLHDQKAGPKKKEKVTTLKSCFIIMPITTPDDKIDLYNGDKDHFKHVLEYLFIPAIKDTGFKPIPPTATGSDVIQAGIMKNLSEGD